MVKVLVLAVVGFALALASQSLTVKDNTREGKYGYSERIIEYGIPLPSKRTEEKIIDVNKYCALIFECNVPPLSKTLTDHKIGAFALNTLFWALLAAGIYMAAERLIRRKHAHTGH